MTERWIGEPEVIRDGTGKPKSIKLAFGPHYFIDLTTDEESGRLTLYLGATHHGIHAQADEVNGELEKFVGELQRSHPLNSF